MRIGLISVDFHPNVGGIAAHVAELGKALAAQDHEVHVVTIPIDTERDRVAELNGMQIHRPPFPKHKPVYTWLTSWWLRRFLRQHPLDVLHVHGLRPLESTKGLPPPVVFTNHSSGFLRRITRGPLERRRLAARLGHVTHVLAPSQQLADATRAVGYTGPVTFISNGVDTERFHGGPATHRERWGAKDDHVVILLARRLVQKNGVAVFAQAVTQLADLPIRIICAGDGPDRQIVERIVRDGGVDASCVFLGNVPNGEMPDIYRSADISVLPSFMEATSITGLESMACGLPLVGTRVGGIPTLIDDGNTGLLVEPGDPSALAQAIRGLADSATMRHSMGERARQRAIDRFSWNRIAARTLEIYSEHSCPRAVA